MSKSLNKTLLKKFAIEARNELRKKVILKAAFYGITSELSDKDRKTNGTEGFLNNSELIINEDNKNRTLSQEESRKRTILIDKIQRINREDRDGFNEVIEEVAYTWFNRFVALRYMEINGYLPSRINILASKDNTNIPEILTKAMDVNLPIDKNLVYELKRDNKNEDLYRYLIELQCGELNKSLPFMFKKVDDYAELVFPAGILSSKFLKTLVDTEIITEEAWSNVEIIGWLYQYYISEEKDRVIKAKKKYKKNEIPFATQLFTPDWIVRYMVQNSLGRYWIESHEEDNDLKENWEFYLENPEKDDDFDKKISPYINKELNVEDIKCFDPACGSGHILVYMFDVLYEIYSRCGYSRNEIPMFIIEKNIYGLDIDMRAYQLTCFAVIMKAMSYDKLFLKRIEREVDTRGRYIDLNIACIKETNILFEDKNTTIHDNIAFLAKEESGENYNKIKAFVESLRNANTFGSLTKLEGFDKEFLENRLKEIKDNPGIDLFRSKSRELWISILDDLIKQSIIMEKTYNILVTNPPYMGNQYMNPILSEFIKAKYKIAKTDLFAAFMYYCFDKIHNNGQLGFITPYSWMFITSYKDLRKLIVDNMDITSLIQLEFNSFPEACVQVCTFTIRKVQIGIDGEYIRLSDFIGVEEQKIKTLEAVKDVNCLYRFRIKTSKFKNIDENPISYWISNRAFDILENEKKLGYYAKVKKGMNTSDNNRFLRCWYEVENNKLGIGYKDSIDAFKSGKKWFPYNKGGGFRKWYGNNTYVINYENDGSEVKSFEKSNIRSADLYFKDCLTWSAIGTTKPFSIRYSDVGAIFDSAGSSVFLNDKINNKYMLGLLQSKVAYYFLKVLNPTLNYGAGTVSKIPIIIVKDDIIKRKIENLVEENVNISKHEFKVKEESYEFKYNDLINTCKSTLSEAVACVKEIYDAKFLKIKKNEENLNQLFKEIYNLDKEVESKVDIDEITFYKFNEKQEIKNLLSYFIGCLFGRYSLDKEGIILAGEKFDINKYSRFLPNTDNIVPILNNKINYFEDDIMIRFEEFLKIAFSEKYLAENIDFIANFLGKTQNESSREAIRRYFCNEFFEDHCKMYKKRPIYWLFTSGKNKAFNCLVYQHRIDKNLLSKMRIDYVQPLQSKLDIEKKDLVNDIESGNLIGADKKKVKDRLKVVEKQIIELREYHDKLRNMADKQIEIDLDDGVVHNHGLFCDLVAKIK